MSRTEIDPKRMGVTELAAAYRDGSLSPVEVTEARLEGLEPGPVLTVVSRERALRQAARAEALLRRGVDPGPMAGVPIVVKDLVDVAGEVTAAGSPVRRGLPPATADAPAVARLDAAGAVVLGRANMTELAFSGLGVNPGLGTPPNPFDPERVPGGSSSGSAAAVAAGIAAAALGSDTGGSVRIPASFCGLVGLKTTDGRIPTDGCVPLSTTLDTLGPIARSVPDARAFWRALAALPHAAPPAAIPARLRLRAPATVWREDADDGVLERFDAAVAALERAGFEVDRSPLERLRAPFELYARFGSFAAHESFALHEELLDAGGVDPRVEVRMRAGQGGTSADYLRLQAARRREVAALWEELRGWDALLAPTVAVPPPRLADLVEDDAYHAANGRVLRNTMVLNFFAGPALSVPIGRDARGLPVGLMIGTAPGRDEEALSIGEAVLASLG